MMKRKQSVKTPNPKRKKSKNLNTHEDAPTFSNSNGWNIQNFAEMDDEYDEEEDEDRLEQEYEKQVQKLPRKSNRLPIKTNDGYLHSVDMEEEEHHKENADITDDDDGDDERNDEVVKVSKTVTAVELFATQSKVLEEKKIQVGSLSAGILENPNEKIMNFRTLFNLLTSNDIGDYITIKKLIIVSLLEVFKDILPSYKLKGSIDKGVKLKKDTLKLEKYEVSLLQYYKKFLQILERMTLILVRKKGSTRITTKPEQKLGEIAVGALCDLLETHPYFNYAENIAQTIVPFLNHRINSVNQKAIGTCKNIFKEDRKGEITLKILRSINQYVKKHSTVNPDMIETLLFLRIKDVNLDEERENILKQQKLMSRKNNVLKLSKMEKKRKARLAELEKELLEAKAEENKQTKRKHQTEITKLAFGLFFRVLKNSQNTKVLGVCLKGIAKFAHCINVEFYVDLINILDSLLKADWLGYCEQQRCIQTVFVILSQQGEILNLDPTRFYNHAYKNLLTSHASRHDSDFTVVLETCTHSLIKRHKKISLKRTASFVKRLCTLSLQLLHNGTLASLGIIKSLLQLNKALDVLLDMDSSPGDGNYMPELEDPEYCNASATCLFELPLLNRHYHPTVAEYSKYIALGAPPNTENSLSNKYGRITPEQMYETYDMSKMAFCPPIPITKKIEGRSKMKYHLFSDSRFKQECLDVLNKRSSNLLLCK